jgi:hypothetical protein
LQEHDRAAATPGKSSILRGWLRPAAPGKIIGTATRLPCRLGVLLQPGFESALLMTILHESRDPSGADSVEPAAVSLLSGGWEPAVFAEFRHCESCGKTGLIRISEKIRGTDERALVIGQGEATHAPVSIDVIGDPASRRIELGGAFPEEKVRGLDEVRVLPRRLAEQKSGDCAWPIDARIF